MLVLLAVAPATAFARPPIDSLPDMGLGADNTLSINQGIAVGQSMVDQMRQRNRLLDDALLTSYLNNLGYQLVSHSQGASWHFKFLWVKGSDVNAFAMPGGFIGVNEGLILATHDESELAAVLAHEISHVTQRHIAQQMEDSRRTGMATAAAVGAALLAGIAGGGNPYLAQAAISGGLAGAYQHQINYTYQDEEQADRIGESLLAQSGFNPDAMATFFQRLQHQEQYNEGPYSSFLRTHPVTTKRIANAQNIARQYPQIHPKPDPSYYIARARARVLAADDPSDSASYFKARLDQTKGIRHDAARYGYALSLAREGDTDQALKLLDELRSRHPDTLAYRLALANFQNQAGNTTASLDTYQSALNLYPDNRAVIESYAEALLQTGRPQKARRLLLRLPLDHSETARQLRLLARAATAMGDDADSHYYMSEYYLIRGQSHMALQQLEIGLHSGHLSSFQRQRLESRRKEIRTAMTPAGRSPTAAGGGKSGQGNGDGQLASETGPEFGLAEGLPGLFPVTPGH